MNQDISPRQAAPISSAAQRLRKSERSLKIGGAKGPGPERQNAVNGGAWTRSGLPLRRNTVLRDVRPLGPLPGEAGHVLSGLLRDFTLEHRGGHETAAVSAVKAPHEVEETVFLHGLQVEQIIAQHVEHPRSLEI